MGICRRKRPPIFFYLLLLLDPLLLLLTSAVTLPTEATDGDMRALLAFKSAADAAGRLSSWNSNIGGGPCGGSWYGVSCVDGRVSRLVLEGLSLSGSSSAELLSSLDQLRVLSLKRNQLSGPLPDLSNLTALKLLFLSGNSFSGPVPRSLGSLSRLYRLDLSANNLSGPIPADALSKGLTHLLTLRLDRNRLSGPISALRLPNLQDFNVSGNLFSGAIPAALAVYPSSAFQGNPGLCGPPVTAACGASAAAGGVVASDPTRPGVPGVGSGPGGVSSSTPAATAVVSSTPGSKPDVAGSATAVAPGNGETAATARRANGGHMSRAVVVAIVVGDFAILVLVTGLLFCYFWKKYSGAGGRSRLQEGEKIVYSSSPYTSQYGGGGGAVVGAAAGASGPGGGVGGFERGKMVFFEGTKRFELEDLLRASAEMLGKGGYGTAYKAVLDDGSVVAVKRLREAAAATGPGAAVGKREFEQHMEVLGRLRHPNVVSLKAYYYARDEKLLVYDFMPNGSLFALLHGNRGPGRTPLDWTTRMRIAAGAARGLAFIHHHSSRKLAHGNIKSTNVLIDKAGNARVSDLGLPLLIHGSTSSSNTGSNKYATAPNNGYRAPEQQASSSAASTKPPSHKADVYAFGVLLLELLTGRYPSQPADGTIPAMAGGAGTAGVVDLPRWVQSVVREEWTAEVFDLELMRYKDIEEEMVGMLQVAMACTAPVPDQRPGMPSVLKMIEEIRGGETSPSHESFDSVSDSPSVSDPDAAVSV